MPPAAKWGNEFRAGARQFSTSALKAGEAVKALYKSANTQMMSPLRTPTMPDNAFEAALNLADFLVHVIEFLRRRPGSR